MDVLLKETWVAGRTLSRSPGYTVTAVLLLALGIGANTAIFSLVSGLLLQPLPYAEPDRLMTLWTKNGNQGGRQDLSSYPNFEDWRSQSTSFSRMVALARTRMPLSSGEGEPEQVPGALVASGFFEVLGIEPRLGRGFAPEEEKRGFENVVVLSHSLWQRRFGADPAILNQRIDLRGGRYAVVGIMPPEFQFPDNAEVWVPLAPNPMDRQERRFLWLEVLGRLKPGVSLSQVREEMDAISHRLEQLHPLTNADMGAMVVPLGDQVVGEARPTLMLLQVAVALVLLIACSNVANLMLARSSSRYEEVAIRGAMGAGRGHILRLQLIESLILALAGGAVGLLVAYWGTHALQAAATAEVLKSGTVRLDGPVLAFTLVLSVLTGVLFGLVPGLRLATVETVPLLKGGEGMATSSWRGSPLRRALVVGEIALALVLLIGAGLLVRSAQRLQAVDLGFEPDGLMALQMVLPQARYQTQYHLSGFFSRLSEEASRLPGVKSAAVVSTLFDGEGSRSDSFTIRNRPPANPTERVEVSVDMVTPGFFQTMGIPLLAGRDFTEQDNLYAPPVVIINQAMAERFWGGEDPVGQSFKYGGSESRDPWMEVIGVVGNTRRSLLQAEPRPATYRPHGQDPFEALVLLVRTDSSPRQQAPALRSLVWSIDSNQAINYIGTVHQMLANQVAERHFRTLLLSLLSVLALVLALVGTYSLVAYLVSRSTREIGIRMALGAADTAVLEPVLRYGLRLAAVGIVVGWVVAFVVTRWMRSLLFGIGATDPMVFLGVPLLLLAAVALATYLPARRAARVDPAVALAHH